LPKRQSQATITIRRSTFEKLEKLKSALGFLTWDELVESLIKCVEEKVKR
jgi:predicted CopG family antitoxin